jgi:hypothetical protein
MISLLTKLGSGVKGAFESGTLGDVLGMLGNISSAVGKNQASHGGNDMAEQVDAINRSYKEQAMARKVGTMVGGATEEYGKGLLASVRAGGTMASYTSPLWQKVSEGMADYGADLRAMALNAKLRHGAFAAQNGANRMAMLSSIVSGVLDTYGNMSSRVPKKKGVS